MKFKKRFNLQLRIFLPLVGLLWIMVIVLGITMYRHESQYRRDVLREQVDVFNTTLLTIFNTEEEMKEYLDIMEGYYLDTALEDMLVSVYDVRTGRYIDGKGYEVKLPDVPDLDGDNFISGMDLETMTPDSIGFGIHDAFYHSVMYSPDSTLVVQTVVPYNSSLVKAISGDKFLWIIISLLLVATMVIAYVSTRHVSRNVQLLRDFADRAANDRDFLTFQSFPDDELGEISAQIVHIYNARSAANAAREHEHRVALNAIEERARLKRQLTNNISHELKTPVGIIKGYVDTIIDNPDMDESSRQHFMRKTQGQVDRLCSLLNDLSTMTRLEESSGAINSEPLNFHELVNSTVDEVEASGLSGSMEITTNVPYDCMVKGNKALLGAMLMNLIKNAVFYSRGSEIAIKCTGQNDKFYTFVFQDNGVGVPEESLSHLFERFYRVETGRSRKTGGTGLGLPIVKSTVNALGGTITVSNRQQGGLQFTFTLPVAKEDDNNEPQ